MLPRRSFGVQPVEMKNAAIKPQAMKAPIFGYYHPAQEPPDFLYTLFHTKLLNLACCAAVA
jgi:hypothetical protein